VEQRRITFESVKLNETTWKILYRREDSIKTDIEEMGFDIAF